MTISKTDSEPLASGVELTESMLKVVLDDGRELAVPIEWFPKLRDATATDRCNWRLIGRGEGIHWPSIDEDISVAGLLRGRVGRRSAERAA
jgi:hypothetical protein